MRKRILYHLSQNNYGPTPLLPRKAIHALSKGWGVYDRKRCRAWEWKIFQEYTGRPECDTRCLHQPEVLALQKKKDKEKKAKI